MAPFYMITNTVSEQLNSHINSEFGETESENSTPRIATTVPLSITAQKRSLSFQRTGSSQSSLARKSWFLNLNILQTSDAHSNTAGHERKLSTQSRLSKAGSTPSPTKASKFPSLQGNNEINGL